MKWLYILLGFKEVKVINADFDTIKINSSGYSMYVEGDTIWVKESTRRPGNYY